ncbi:MAG TPA: NADH-quinone oxidoreductase subunit NuoE [Burkholderiaceae bacterium]|nr:NADH-quinone oxidoreductase subunit NuoE [Burkholderiaceae bacterium]
MSAVPQTQRLLSADAYRRIDREVAKFPSDQKQSAVMAALHIAQSEKGWLSQDVIDDVAAYLEMPPIAVWEVATFYNMYDTKPVGKYKISVCTNLPCALSGGERAASYLKDKLGIDYKETTADGRFTLIEGECMGACGDAPVMLVNNVRMCSFMSPDKLDALIDELKKD